MKYRIKIEGKRFSLQFENGYAFLRLWRWEWERIAA